ncbi:MAG: hypothetical protein JWN67_5054 [Actinomycetia bacterium]|nr:hypothetical protein [Actinomycetes bacterium]
MSDEDRWERLLLHLYDQCTEVCWDLTNAERAAVRLYTVIHHRLEHPTI